MKIHSERPRWAMREIMEAGEAADKAELNMTTSIVRVGWKDRERFDDRFSNPAIERAFQAYGIDPETCIEGWKTERGDYLIKICWTVTDAFDYFEAEHLRDDVDHSGLCRCGCGRFRPLRNSMYFSRVHMEKYLAGNKAKGEAAE